MIEIRRCQLDDWKEIAQILKASDEPLPDLKNLLSASVIVKDGKVIAFGYLTKYVEATFYPLKESKRDAVSALKLLSEQLELDAKELDVDVVHVFSKNHEFTEILKKHFKYEDCLGDAICLEVPNV